MNKQMELAAIMEENTRKMKEAEAKLAEQQLFVVEEKRKLDEERRVMAEERKKQSRIEQNVILGKKGSRPKLKFGFGTSSTGGR